MPFRRFRVSPTGSGCGLAVVTLGTPSGELLLQIHVLPKFWGTRVETHLDLDVAPIGSRKTMRICAFEGQGLLVKCEDAGILLALGNALSGVEFIDASEEGFGDLKPVALFSEEALRAHEVFSPALSGSADDPTDMWALLENAQETSLLRIPASASRNEDLSTYLATTLLPHVPELLPLHAKLLILETEPLVLRRRREFRVASDRVRAIRGRIDLRDLADRRATRRQSVMCHFDELDSDTIWMRVLRAAVRQAARDLAALGHDSLATRAWRIDRHLSDVQILSPRQALDQSATKRLDRADRNKGRAIALARGYLRGRFPFGLEDSPNALRVGVAAAVRFSTPALFEHLLAGVQLSGGSSLRAYKGVVLLHGGSDATPSGKHPDLRLVMEDGETLLNVDAKYKSDPGALSAMPMSDSYQQYGYAAATGRDTLFVYVSQSVDPDYQWNSIVVNGAVTDVKVGLASVPFPSDANVAEWRLSAAAILSKAIPTPPSPKHLLVSRAHGARKS